MAKTKKELVRIKARWWNSHKADFDLMMIEDDLYRVIDMCIAMGGRATGL